MSDVTLAEFPDGWQRASVIVAHPDDIEWGVAGAVAAWTAAGRTVSYVLVTSGEAGIDSMAPDEARVAREAEERASGAIVGVSEIEFLGHPDGRVVEDLALRRDIAAAIRRQRPDVVVAQYRGERWGDGLGRGWNSADHRAVGRATMDAVSDAANRWIFPDLDGEPWAGDAVDRRGGRPVDRDPRRRHQRRRRRRRALARRPRAVPARARRRRPGGLRDERARRPRPRPWPRASAVAAAWRSRSCPARGA